MGISKVNKEKQDKLDPIAYERYCNGESITRIAKDFKMDRTKLSKRLQEKYKIQVCLNGGKKDINSNYFSILNRENAYWLGVILADGSIYNFNKFELTLKDKDHIELFKKHLNSKHEINVKEIDGEKYYRISFTDTQIVNDLMSYGILPNKSHIDFHLPVIPDVLFNDFLRGIIDGDGMIYLSKNDNSRFHIYISVGFSCPTYMKELCSKICSFYGVNAKYSIQRTCYRIQLYKKDTLKIIKELYKDTSLYMKRKYEKCKKFL